MTSPAPPLGNPRHDAMRWIVCLAVAIAGHGAAALALLLNTSSASDFDAGAPVVMIELPEAPAPPPSDLAPGPAEPESEEAPPPKEETKPPEEVAEVALPEPEPPKPEPPKPEPPAEDKPPTAMPSAVMAMTNPAPPTAGAEVQPSNDLLRHRWQSELVAHIERFKRYPAKARARGQQGLARVAFTIDIDGRVRASRIVQSSGSPELDQESLAMLTRAQPMPKPPHQVETSELSFVVPIRFNIR